MQAGAPQDVRGVLGVFNRSLPFHGWDAQQVAHAERRASLPGTVVVGTDHDGTIAGCGWLRDLVPGVQQAVVAVDRSSRGRGWGTALLDALAVGAGGIAAGTQVLVDRSDPASVAFARRRLDAEDRGDPTSPPLSFCLDLRRPASASVSATPTVDVVEVGPGHALYDATLDLYEQLVPGAMETRAETVAWETERLDLGGLLLAAVAGARVIGVCVGSAVPWASLLYSDYTLVHDEWRGRGVATALKTRQRDVVRARGWRWIVTDVPTAASPMVGVLRSLGYSPWEREGLYSRRSIPPGA